MRKTRGSEWWVKNGTSSLRPSSARKSARNFNNNNRDKLKSKRRTILPLSCSSSIPSLTSWRPDNCSNRTIGTCRRPPQNSCKDSKYAYAWSRRPTTACWAWKRSARMTRAWLSSISWTQERQSTRASSATTYTKVRSAWRIPCSHNRSDSLILLTMLRCITRSKMSQSFELESRNNKNSINVCESSERD